MFFLSNLLNVFVCRCVIVYRQDVGIDVFVLRVSTCCLDVHVFPSIGVIVLVAPAAAQAVCSQRLRQPLNRLVAVVQSRPETARRRIAGDPKQSGRRCH